jgi:hypothetical protein
MKSNVLYLFIFLNFSLLSQTTTVGLISHSAGSTDNGYVLFAPMMCDTTYLIDKCGNLVHRWNSAYKPGLAVYLLEDGTLLRTGNVMSPNFTTGGKGGIIERLDWNGNVLWSYTISTTTTLSHHDTKMMPNGNILAIVWVKKTKADMITAGGDLSLIGNSVLSEQILELQPVGTNSANIVWTWNLWDHLVQDYDNTKANYDTVAQNPQLFNLNYGMSTNPDWIHLNSVDYNPVLDQIIINSRNINEFYVLDHSTTTAEAASHNGGIYGKGGDFLYRWGNPAAYDQGTALDQKLFGQHNVQWITNPQFHQKDLLLFNDGIGRTGGTNYSSVEFLTPPCSAGVYNQTIPYLPLAQNWIYTDTPPTNFFASYTSGAQLLDNGHVLICNGPAGYFFEVDTLKNKVWEYINPVGMVVTTQGNTPMQNNAFRCVFYDSTYAGFAGKTLIPGAPIEINPNPSTCTPNIGINKMERENGFKVYPNPTSGLIDLEIKNSNYTFTVTDAYGQLICKAANAKQYNFENLSSGFYTIHVLTNEGYSFTKKIIVSK